MATGDVEAYHASDFRLKNNIEIISNALDKVLQLNGIEFDWNEKSDYNGKHDIGIIAQELLKIAPELVVQRENGYYAIKYDKVVAILIEAIKELYQKIEYLTK